MEFLTFPISRPGVEVSVTLEVYEENDEVICGLRWMQGEIKLGPKALRRAITEELENIESIARSAGCAEIRHAGDDWSRFMTEYSPMSGLRNGLFKRL